MSQTKPLDWDQKFDRYSRQQGTIYLTVAQRRSIRKSIKREKKLIGAVAFANKYGG